MRRDQERVYTSEPQYHAGTTDETYDDMQSQTGMWSEANAALEASEGSAGFASSKAAASAKPRDSDSEEVAPPLDERNAAKDSEGTVEENDLFPSNKEEEVANRTSNERRSVSGYKIQMELELRRDIESLKNKVEKLESREQERDKRKRSWKR